MMHPERMIALLRELVSLPCESEWVEFKHNKADPRGIGEYVSSLSNSAALHGRPTGYLVWGIEDGTHNIVGTTFRSRAKKIGNEELENWLARLLEPRIDVKINEFVVDGKQVVIFEIPKATYTPIRFQGEEWIRIGSYKKKLKDFPEKERELWASFAREPFEKGIAKENISADEVLSLLNYPAYFDLTAQRLPDDKNGILARLEIEKLIASRPGSHYDITNLGGILFAKKLDAFERLARKAIRVIIYKGKDRLNTLKEQIDIMGYAVGFEGAIQFINDQLPQNEEVGQALRKNVRMYPEIAVRELVANSIIHQDFAMTGTGPMVEIFSDRIEISNPGVSLVDTMRFIDEPPQSRNEALAAFMRRINICEERGTGIDKVVFNAELYQLPAPNFITTTNHTKTILFARKKLSGMNKDDRMRACYQHACLRYVSNEIMTNATLRKRFSISKQNYSIASRIISETIEAGLIRKYDPESASKKHAKYVPFWV